MKTYKTAAVLITFFILSFNVAAQLKYEREFNLSPDKVPAIAKKFVDSCCPGSKVKWYGEESFKGKSIEAKLKYYDAQYSIEYDTSGNIQDVEKTIQLNSIPTNTFSAIIKNLDAVFSKYKIEKIQVQWMGSTLALYELIRQNNSSLPYTIHYEIVLKGRKEKGMKMYEILFSPEGTVLSISEIVQRNTDNLDY